MTTPHHNTYNERYQQMNFAQLRAYIDEMLDALSDPLHCTNSGPRTKQDFIALVQLLESKISKPKLPPIPIPPELPQIPPKPAPFPEYVPSLPPSVHNDGDKPKLVANNFDAIKNFLEQEELMNKEFQEQEARKKAHHALLRKAHYKPYLTALAAHKNAPLEREAQMRRYHAECDRIQKEHKELVANWQRFIERIRRKIESTFACGAPVQVHTVRWRVLPPGECTLENIVRHYEMLQRLNPHVQYDLQRIESVFTLAPSTCYIGTEEFDGYIVFAFKNTQKVVLECPIYGNAVYVIRSGWQSLSRLSKSELLTNYMQLVIRILHKGEWFQRLKDALR